MGFQKKGKVAMSANGKRKGGSDESKAGSRKHQQEKKLAKQKEAALGEKGESMTQRFSRRAPPGTYTCIDTYIHTPHCVCWQESRQRRRGLQRRGLQYHCLHP